MLVAVTFGRVVVDMKILVPVVLAVGPVCLEVGVEYDSVVVDLESDRWWWYAGRLRLERCRICRSWSMWCSRGSGSNCEQLVFRICFV